MFVADDNNRAGTRSWRKCARGYIKTRKVSKQKVKYREGSSEYSCM